MWELNLSNYTHPLLGTVPKNWKWSRINEICTLSSGGTPSRKEKDNFKGNILWVTSGELKNRTIEDTLEKISDGAVEEFNLTLYDPGTVIIAIYGLEAEGVRGTASILKKKSTISQACMAFANFQGLSNVYFYYWYLNYGTIIGKRYAQGTKQQNLSQDIVATIPICYPSISEQQKIVTILSTQDKVIELKEKLLAQKQQQKKYLMQQLLTGKKRLPGFDRKWNYVKANEIFKSIVDKSHDGKLEVLSSTQDKGIVPRSQVDIDIKYNENSLSTYKKVCEGDFVISLRSFQGGIEYSNYAGIVSPAYTVLRAIVKIDAGYYKQFFKSSNYIKRLNVAVYGIRDGKQISYDDFGRIKIPVPPIEEQREVAKILSTADHEIDLLQKSIEAEKQKKKALMQLLLTGKVRVKI